MFVVIPTRYTYTLVYIQLYIYVHNTIIPIRPLIRIRSEYNNEYNVKSSLVLDKLHIKYNF